MARIEECPKCGRKVRNPPGLAMHTIHKPEEVNQWISQNVYEINMKLRQIYTTLTGNIPLY